MIWWVYKSMHGRRLTVTSQQSAYVRREVVHLVAVELGGEPAGSARKVRHLQQLLTGGPLLGVHLQARLQENRRRCSDAFIHHISLAPAAVCRHPSAGDSCHTQQSLLTMDSETMPVATMGQQNSAFCEIKHGVQYAAALQLSSTTAHRQQLQGERIELREAARQGQPPAGSHHAHDRGVRRQPPLVRRTQRAQALQAAGHISSDADSPLGPPATDMLIGFST